MRQGKAGRPYYSRIPEYLGRGLHEQCDEIMHEPLPERWFDLINYLYAREEEARRAATLAHEPFTNTPPPREVWKVAATLKYVVLFLIGATALFAAVVLAVPTVPLRSSISMAALQSAP